jgi:hypothetical protein
MISQGTFMMSALPKIMTATGWYFDKVKSLLTVLKIFCLPSPPIVTALSAARAIALLFMIAISAVIFGSKIHGKPNRYTRPASRSGARIFSLMKGEPGAYGAPKSAHLFDTQKI